MESYRKGLVSEEMSSAIKMIKRMGRERVEKSGKYVRMGERENQWRGWVAAYSELFHYLFPIYSYLNFSSSISDLC